jgi:hypothetical protein
VMYQAFHAGIKVPRYFSDPISVKMAADPRKEMTKANKMLIIMLVIRSFLSRFFRAASVSCTNSLRMTFNSLNNASIISLKEVN